MCFWAFFKSCVGFQIDCLLCLERVCCDFFGDLHLCVWAMAGSTPCPAACRPRSAKGYGEPEAHQILLAHLAHFWISWYLRGLKMWCALSRTMFIYFWACNLKICHWQISLQAWTGTAIPTASTASIMADAWEKHRNFLKLLGPNDPSRSSALTWAKFQDPFNLGSIKSPEISSRFKINQGPSGHCCSATSGLEEIPQGGGSGSPLLSGCFDLW
jgi:hypothetical protein